MSGVRFEVAELSLSALDGAAVDAVAVFVGPERPLQGLAGLVDWRLAGALTRAMASGHFGGAEGEQLLLPTQGRLPARRLVAFGAATPAADGTAYRTAAYRALDALRRAGSRAHAVSLPPHGPGLSPAEAARIWLEACVRFPAERQLLLGDAAALRRDLALARDSLKVNVEIAAADGARPGSLSPGSAVLR
ncbi:MAG TPA: M17 family peptidase N-terminal domain-containing protein [Anaeromyxobacteraceae bacterium]